MSDETNIEFHSAKDQHPEPSRLGAAAATVIGVIPIFATLAYGAVEPWAFAIIALLTGVLVAIWAIDGLLRGQLRIAVSALMIPFAALIGIGIIQLLPLRTPDAPGIGIPVTSSLTLNPYVTRIAVVQLAIQLIFFAGALTFFDTSRRLKRMAVGIVVFGGSMAFFGILQWLANPQGIYGWRPTPQAIPFASFVNQHHFAALMEMTTGIALGLFLGKATKKDKRVLLIIAVALMTVAVVLTGSRGGLLSILIVAVTAAALGHVRDETESDAVARIPRKLALIGFGTAFAVLLVAMVVFLGGDASLLRGIGFTAQGDVSSGRFHFWNVALRIFLDHPFLGAGLDSFATAYPRYDTWNGSFRVEQAHNDYLQILADAGIAGFACVAAFVVLLIKKSLRVIRDEDERYRRAVAVGALAGCVGILVHSFFDFPLRTPANAFVMIILVVLATTSVKFRHRNRSHRRG